MSYPVYYCSEEVVTGSLSLITWFVNVSEQSRHGNAASNIPIERYRGSSSKTLHPFIASPAQLAGNKHLQWLKVLDWAGINHAPRPKSRILLGIQKGGAVILGGRISLSRKSCKDKNEQAYQKIICIVNV